MEKVLVLDFGGQYDLLIARRVRENGVFAEVLSYDRITPEEIKAAGYKGIIFTGGPNSVYDEKAPRCGREVLELGIPVLGICYGHQAMTAWTPTGTASWKAALSGRRGTSASTGRPRFSHKNAYFLREFPKKASAG